MPPCKHASLAALLLGLAVCADEPREETQQSTAAGSGGIETSPTSATDPDPTDPDSSSSSSDGSSDEFGGSPNPLLDVGAPDGPGPKDATGTDLGCQFIDVLFVVDISASVSQERANLAANFPGFVSVLDDYVSNNGARGYRVGVTNSSINGNYGGCDTTMGLDGTLVSWGDGFFDMSDCGTGGTPWLDGPAAGLSENFSCLAENLIPTGQHLD